VWGVVFLWRRINVQSKFPFPIAKSTWLIIMGLKMVIQSNNFQTVSVWLSRCGPWLTNYNLHKRATSMGIAVLAQTQLFVPSNEIVTSQLETTQAESRRKPPKVPSPLLNHRYFFFCRFNLYFNRSIAPPVFFSLLYKSNLHHTGLIV
jgi:hypothetical protein